MVPVLRNISDTLFLISLAVLMVSAIMNGINFQSFLLKRKDDDPRKLEVPVKSTQLEKQNKGLTTFFRSKLTWIGLACVFISVALSYIERYV
ncbi:hypothetical protein [Paenibacillus sp. FJAT-26967]|uniref:hypothetical protein n=1 Tax=Paenibacillus sp. FJAT-26967 TaxID=1729690 RepID=UPI0020A55CE0|nr:hypothetical protein [Paenibacillus sp. FJAT-26967]